MIPPFSKGACLNSRYRIKELIDGGGEAWVHLAKDLQCGDRVVIRQYQRNDPEERIRWERECNARVKSEHVIRHLDGGESNGSLYVVVEFLEGQSLDQYLADMGAYLAGDEPVQITRQIAQGLADLHALGLVHRDLKSANVLIGNGGTKVVKIIDLGLLRVRRAPTIANDGMARGTLHYMSPEHLIAPHTVGPRSDLFSLGVISYELNTGTLPFDGANPADIQGKILKAEPIAPRRLRPDLNPRHEATILKLLAKDPAARFQSAASLLLHLDGQGGGHPCPTCRTSCATDANYCPSCGVELCAVRSASAMLCVEMLQGPRWLAVPPHGIALGRSLLDPVNRAVSTRHARIFQDGGTWYLEDLDSTNGTRADGSRIRGRVRLSRRSFLQFADVTCVFYINSC